MLVVVFILSSFFHTMIYSWEPAFGSAVSFSYGFDKPAGGLYVEKKHFLYLSSNEDWKTGTYIQKVEIEKRMRK